MGACIVRYDSERTVPFVIEHWEAIDLRAYTASLATISVVSEFLKRPQFYEVDTVIIESQERAVRKMQRLSNAIQSHFETVKALRNKRYGVVWSSGDVKLRVYEGPITWNTDYLKTMNKYRRNKRTGEEHTRAILNSGVDVRDLDCCQWLLWYERLEKKDDVADSFLQGAFYLKERSMVPSIKTALSGKKRKSISLPPFIGTAATCLIIDDDPGDDMPVLTRSS